MNDAASCCADFYEKDWVAALLGDSFHPGGPALSGRLVASLEIGPSDRVLDVASGSGTTALEIARGTGAQVVGLDYSSKNVERARARASKAGLSDSVEFQVGDVAELPFGDSQFDAVLCECAVSTFARKRQAAAEMARVLRPGGQLGISDMCLDAPLPEDLAAAVGPWACLQDALDVEGYQRLFLDSGLRITSYDDETDALRAMALDLKRKLVVVGLGKMAGGLAELDLDIGSARKLLDEARDLVDAGQIQYCRLTFSRGQPQRRSRSESKRSVRRSGCDPSTGCC